jgi:hypothetical protein
MFLLTSLALSLNISVYYNTGTGQFTVQEGLWDAYSVARGLFLDTFLQTGYSELQIEGSEIINDATITSRAAGYAEAYLTRSLFKPHWENMKASLCKDWIVCQGDGTLPSALTDFMSADYQWVLEYLHQAGDTDFFRGCRLLLAQFQGLVDGYNNFSTDTISYGELWAYVSSRHLYDLARNLGVAKERAIQPLLRQATGFVAHPGDFKDIYIGHTSWRNYGESLKIAKRYRFRFPDNLTRFDRRVSSSAVFMLHSDDDFEMSDNAVVHLSSSIAVNKSVISTQISAMGLPSWMRALASSYASSSPSQWFTNYQTNPLQISGIEHLIVDLKKFKYADGFDTGFAFVVDEYINGILGQDVSTAMQNNGYVGTYDIPLIDEIYDRAGYPGFAAEQPLFFDREQAARPQILKARARITAFNHLRTLIRLNDPAKVVQQQNSTAAAIAARYDLLSTNAGCYGAIDAKATSLARILHLQWEGVTSPTFDNSPVFSFNCDACANVAHGGLPDVLNSTWNSHYFDLAL